MQLPRRIVPSEQVLGNETEMILKINLSVPDKVLEIIQKLASSSIVRHPFGDRLDKFAHFLFSAFCVTIKNVILVFVNPVSNIHVLLERQQHVVQNDGGIQQSKGAMKRSLVLRDLHSDGTQPRESSFQDSNCVFRAHSNLGQQLVEPVMLVGNFFAGLFLVGRNHERTVRKGTVSNVEFILVKAIFRMLKQVHVAVNSVVVGRTMTTRMAAMDLSVVITNDHDGQSASVFSSFVVRSVLGLGFKGKWEQGAVGDSNHVRKSSFLLHFPRKFLCSSLFGHV